MKHIPVLLAALALAAACNKTNVSPEVAENAKCGTIEFNISTSEATKAITQYTTVQSYEKVVKSVQVLVFGEDGKINNYLNGTSLSGSISTTTGSKTIWAVINGPDLSTTGSLTSMQGTILDLSLNGTSADGSFVMAGNGNCTVSATSTVNCAISAKRFLSRIALVSITNNLPASYGPLLVNRVFLSNVVGGIAATGDYIPGCRYVNKNGRADKDPRSESDIIGTNGNEATCPELTFSSRNLQIQNAQTNTPSKPILLYAYPNECTTEPNGFQSSYEPRKTVLVVEASIQNHVYYYPVVMKDGIGRNKLYSIGLTVTALGSDDPEEVIEKGSASFSITVADWENDAVYEETI